MRTIKKPKDFKLSHTNAPLIFICNLNLIDQMKFNLKQIFITTFNQFHGHIL